MRKVANKVAKKVAKKVANNSNSCYNPFITQSKIYHLLLDNSKYTIRDLVQESGFSDGYVRKIITTLKNQHMIERVGSNKTGYWKIHTNSQID